MTAGLITTIALFITSLIFNLVGFLIVNLFIKRIDKLTEGFEKMADKLEQFVKVQDHKDDVSELKKRIEKLEDKSNY